MKFDLMVHPKTTHHNEEYDMINSEMELSVSREEFIAQFEKDAIECVIAMREMLYIFYFQYGFQQQIGDEVCYNIYDALMECNDIISFSVHVSEEDFFDNSNYRRRSRNVKVDFTLNTKDSHIQSDLLQ